MLHTLRRHEPGRLVVKKCLCKPCNRLNPTRCEQLRSGCSSLDATLFQPATKVNLRSSISLGNEFLARTVGEECFNLKAVFIKLAFASSRRTSELHPSFSFSCQSLFGALANQIAL